MSTNSTQIGDTPSEPLINNTENETDIDQLLTVDIVITTQSLLQPNMTNMMHSQIPTIFYLQEAQFFTRRREARRRQHQRRSQRRRERRTEAQLQQQEQQIRRRQRRERQYERRLNAQYARYAEQDRRENAEREHHFYLQQRSPTFNEWTEEIIDDRLLEAYNLETMDPNDRWDQQQLNELEGIATLEQLALIQDELDQQQQIDAIQQILEEEQQTRNNEELRQIEQYETLIQDEIEQNQQINTIQQIIEEQQQTRNNEELIQLEQWEQNQFLLQQMKQP